MKRFVLVHGWMGNPGYLWFPALKSFLESQGHKVLVPEMPDTNKPVINTWLTTLKETVGGVDENTVFIGHSIGCQTIFRFLEQSETNASGVLCVGGWFTLKEEAFEDDEDRAIAKPWLENPMDDAKVQEKAGSISAIFSDNDPFVPVENAQIFKERLNAKTRVEENRFHFDKTKSLDDLPEIKEELNAFL